MTDISIEKLNGYVFELIAYIQETEKFSFEEYVSNEFPDEFSGMSYEAWLEGALEDDRVQHIYKTAILASIKLEEITERNEDA
jgi:hypothetical protein